MHPPNSRFGPGTTASNIRKLRNLGKFINFIKEKKYSCYSVLKLIGGGNFTNMEYCMAHIYFYLLENPKIWDSIYNIWKIKQKPKMKSRSQYAHKKCEVVECGLCCNKFFQQSSWEIWISYLPRSYPNGDPQRKKISLHIFFFSVLSLCCRVVANIDDPLTLPA